jgi:hypothetical protein
MADAKGNVFEALMIGLVFNATSIPGLADNDQTSPLATLSLQLHTASPGEAGNLTTSEADYTGYTRVATERTSTGWTVSGTSANLTATVAFPQCGGGSNLITHFSIGNSTVAASTGTMYYYGTVTPNITVTNGVTPRLTTLTAVSEL